MTARYQFLPWVRQGAANAHKNRDAQAVVLAPPPGGRLGAMPVRLEVNGETDVDVALRVYGPGAVTGIDARVVIRVDPPPRTADREPNLLTCVEFDTPDFPWLFTPAAAGENGRLRPWLVLVVLHRDRAGIRRGGDHLPVLTAPASELPDLKESWAWAHAQGLQVDETATVEEILAAQPERNLSRLICPRRLEAHSPYLACLVPAFAAGRKAGLGVEVTQADEDRLAPAWEAKDGQVELPVYHAWEFATGAGGDFETLALRLRGRQVPASIGRRTLRVSDQPFGIPDVAGLEFVGPLVAPRSQPEPVIGAVFRERLRAVLNLNTAATPVVTPPLYGSWQAAQPAVPADGAPPLWLGELNLDPALRAAAGLGARVVQVNQEQLVAAAWDQLGDAPGVTRLERRLDVTVAVLDSVLRRRVATLPVGRVVQFLGPAHARMRTAPETLHASLARQGLPPSFSSPAFRRTLRPAGTLARRRSPTPRSLQRLATRVGTAVPAIGPAAGAPGFFVAKHVSDQRGRLPSTLLPSHRRYVAALTDVQRYMVRFARLPEPRPPRFQFTATLKTELVASLDPRKTATRRFRARIERGDGAAPADRGSALAQPSFPQPMSRALSELAPEFLLPGIGEIAADTVTLLRTNSRFIEAYMLGLNHELAGELLWREFPGDVRHTYFRRFWDSGPGAQPLPQLPLVRSWDPAAALGKSFAGGTEQLVLLIRGELLQRYPDALIHAVKARRADALGTEELLPLFRGRIEPDVTFLGFDLTAEQARGTGGGGWFFVIQEQPSAPSFGLDETRERALASWNDLAWSDVRTTPGGHVQMRDLNVPANQRPAGPSWGLNAAHMAAILRQRPVRIAFHAAHLLPPAEEPTPR